MSSSSQDKKKKKSPPSFSGTTMPTNISFSMDDGAEEVTRRVGVGAMPSFQPNFGPMPSFGSAGVAPHFGPPSSHGPAFIETSRPKAAAPMVQTPKPSFKGWQLRQVPPLPEYHPLERTAVFVPHQPSPESIAKRISEVLRDRSIEAFYEDDKAKVKCVTEDGVDFRVRLYRGRGEYNHGIIVEVQRRFGTSLDFHKDATAILDAAEGKMPPPPPPPLMSGSGSSLPYVSDTEDDYQPSAASSLAMVSKMLRYGYDSRYLAFQTLSSLTDGAKMGTSTAKKVSKELLRPDNEVGGNVLALVVDKKEEEDIFNLRGMALTVLANAIQAVGGDVDDELREQLRPVLLGELRKSKSNPRSAQLSCRCLEYLIREDHNVSELCEGLEFALEVGRGRHAGLMRQAQSCLDKVNGGSR